MSERVSHHDGRRRAAAEAPKQLLPRTCKAAARSRSQQAFGVHWICIRVLLAVHSNNRFRSVEIRNSMNSKVAGKTDMHLLLLLVVCALLALQPPANALVAVPLPGRNINTGWPSPAESPTASPKQETVATSTAPATVIVRKTTKDDIAQISILLAMASAGNDALDSSNWNTKMQILRDQNTYNKLLSQRLDVLEAGKKAARKAQDALVDEECIFNKDGHTDHRNHFMWYDNAFRQKLERAVKAVDATERHAWHGYNFAIPPNPSLLQHVMLTAVDANTDTVAGFCEVAMLPSPDDASGHSHCLPMIANLVTSPDYRRRGVASNLLKSARRYVRCCWGPCDDMPLGLYVERDNTAAKALYARQGFVEEGTCSHKTTRLYMSLQQSYI